MNRFQRATDSLKELLFYYVVIVVAAAAAFSWFEGHPFLTGLWWACSTAMTVGYGDVVPVTIGGSIVAVILMHIVVLFLLPLVVVRLVTAHVDNLDRFSNEEQEQIKDDLKAIRAHLAAHADVDDPIRAIFDGRRQ